MTKTLLKISWSFALVWLVSEVLLSSKSVATELDSGEDSSLLSDLVSRGPASTSRNVISRKRYPGGADEDDLQVQAVVPIPTRTFDGTMGAAPTNSSSETSGAEPALND